MQASDVRRATAAATSIASDLGLAVDDAVVLHDSNLLTLRLLPCDVVARVAQPRTRVRSSKSTWPGGWPKPRARSPRSSRGWNRASTSVTAS